MELKEVFRSWDGVAFYVSKGSSYRGRTYYGLYDMGMTVCTDNMPTGITYIPIGIDNVNVGCRIYQRHRKTLTYRTLNYTQV